MLMKMGNHQEKVCQVGYVYIFLLLFILFLFLLSVWFPSLITCILSSGTNRDVGEVLVKTLQNTRYSIDEKLEQSFINLFGNIRPTASEDNDVATGNILKKCGQSNEFEIEKDQVQPSEQAVIDHISGGVSEKGKSDYEVITEQSDEDDSVESDYSPEDQHEHDEQNPFSHDLKEKVEYRDGRSRRKAISSKYEDGADAEVINIFSLLLPILMIFHTC